MTLRGLLCVGAGGFIGAIVRYTLSLWIDGHAGTTFPLATFLINVTGSFVLGLLSGALEFATSVPPEVRLTVGVGFLGAYTTFSTFSYETLRLVEAGDTAIAVGYVAASVAAGFTAAILGMALGRSL